MKKLIYFIPALFGLAACAQLTAVDSNVKTACLAAQAVEAFVPATDPTVQNLKSYVDAGCGTEADVAKLAADPTAFDWLAKLKADLQKFM